MNGIMVGILTLRVAFGFTEEEFRLKAARLREQQAQADAWIRQLGGGSSNRGPSPDEEKERTHFPLYQLHASLSSPRLPVGKLIYGKLLTRLVVGTENSPALVVLDSGQGALSGLRMMGAARQAGTEGRIHVDLNRLLLRSGKAIPTQATALDDTGALGLRAQVFSNKAWAVVGSLATSFISGAASAQQTQTMNGFGFNQTQPSTRNSILQGVAQTAADQSKRLIEDATKEKPVLVADPGTPVAILIQEEVRW